jgi:hypothetical protein
MLNDATSSLLVEQRVRNRIIEWLEVVAAYQVDPPPYDLNEILNQWQDWNATPASVERYPQPVYTHEEARSLVSVGVAWSEFCEATPNRIVHEGEHLSKPEWAKLVAASNGALSVLCLRGRLSEESAVGRAKPQA